MRYCVFSPSPTYGNKRQCGNTATGADDTVAGQNTPQRKRSTLQRSSAIHHNAESGAIRLRAQKSGSNAAPMRGVLPLWCAGHWGCGLFPPLGGGNAAHFALADHRRRGTAGTSPPGHRQDTAAGVPPKHCRSGVGRCFHGAPGLIRCTKGPEHGALHKITRGVPNHRNAPRRYITDFRAVQADTLARPSRPFAC